jgi:hypothetical protein
MDSAPPTTQVWHPYHGDLVVVAAPGIPEFESAAQQYENMKGPGTWTIPYEVHVRSLRTMNEAGDSSVGANDFRWVPWSELQLKARG